ncbi:mitochondrial import receptor subunit TOM40B-like [Vicugna pacos]|uniref:Mitochondrial import receptor subunit TOM40B-like n=1 Tax=Vicugna pacos TaxID=30538 RepID=A0ABM5EFA7_VICPA
MGCTGYAKGAHTVHMSALGLPSYHLHAAYAGDWQLSPTETQQAKFLTWHFGGENRGDDYAAILTLAGKYSAVHCVATFNVGSGGAHARYYHRANEQVQVGVEFEANTRLQDTTFSFGYRLTLPQANMVFRGLVDSNWCVGAVLERKMPPLPVTLALGAFLNNWRNRFHCGFSITVG